MRLCTDTITIYNAYHDTESDCTAYSKTVVSGVSWYGSLKATASEKGLTGANAFTIRIPVDADCGGKTYVAPSAFRANPSADGFTLANGDLIVHGAVDADDMRPKELHKGHEVVTILGVTDNRRAPNAPHWKVVCA